METLQKISRDVLTYINNHRPKITVIDFEKVIKHEGFSSLFEIIYPVPPHICFQLVHKTTGNTFSFCTHNKSKETIKPLLFVYWDPWIRYEDKIKEVRHFEWIESEKYEKIFFYPSIQRCIADPSSHYAIIDFLVKNGFVEKKQDIKIIIGQNYDYVIAYNENQKEWTFEIVIPEHVLRSMREMTGDFDRPWLDQDEKH